MESLYIQQIFRLTESILRGEYQFETTQRILQNHLDRARNLNLPVYEAEVLNTLGILHLLAGHVDQQQMLFLQGLEKANQTSNIDLRMKLCNNLTEVYLENWDFENAERYLSQGLALGREEHSRTLVMLYLYSNSINFWTLRGDYAQAATLLEEVWKLGEAVDLLQYSRYEYFQVIFLLRNLQAVVDIAQGNCESALAALHLAQELTRSTTNADYHRLVRITRFYYALLCKRDEAEAAQAESAVREAAEEKLPFNFALTIAYFMHHNRQPALARKYAQMALNEAETNANIPASALVHARRILA